VYVLAFTPKRCIVGNGGLVCTDFRHTSPTYRQHCNRSQTDGKTKFSIKWYLKVIQGQAFWGHWKADKTDRALHDDAA